MADTTGTNESTGPKQSFTCTMLDGVLKLNTQNKEWKLRMTGTGTFGGGKMLNLFLVASTTGNIPPTWRTFCDSELGQVEGYLAANALKDFGLEAARRISEHTSGNDWPDFHTETGDFKVYCSQVKDFATEEWSHPDNEIEQVYSFTATLHVPDGVKASQS